MSNGSAGYKGRIYATATDTTPGSGDLLGDTTDQNFTLSSNLLDASVHGGDTSRDYVYGLIESGYDVSMLFVASSTVQALIENAVLNRTDLWFHYRPEGTTAKTYKTKCKVESLNVSSAVDDLATFSFTVKGTALTTITTS